MIIMDTIQLPTDLPRDSFYGTLDARIECFAKWDETRHAFVFDKAVWKGGNRAAITFELIASLDSIWNLNAETGDLWLGALHLKVVERDLLRAMYIVERAA